MRYPLQQAQEEVAFIAYHFHWARESLLEMSHLERRRWVEQISEINQRANEEADARMHEYQV